MDARHDSLFNLLPMLGEVNVFGRGYEPKQYRVNLLCGLDCVARSERVTGCSSKAKLI